MLNDIMDENDPVLVLDLSRLGIIRSERARFADNYFDEFAGEQSRLSRISADEELINQLLFRYVQQENIGELLDVGTGNGRMLLLLGSKIEKAIGIDNSREMLAIARTNLEQANLKNCQVRIGDMYRLPFAENRFGLITINSLLRYAEKPKDVLTEATRVLKPGGILFIVDFSDHGLTELRDEYGHRWLGFSKDEMLDILDGEKIRIESTNFFKGEVLTVCVWKGQKVENG
jgi:ArsR family transcriptional regulator